MERADPDLEDLLETKKRVKNPFVPIATLRSMSYHIFMVYTYAIASIMLLPLQFLFTNTINRSAGLALLSISVPSKISLLSLIGDTLQILRYTLKEAPFGNAIGAAISKEQLTEESVRNGLGSLSAQRVSLLQNRMLKDEAV